MGSGFTQQDNTRLTRAAMIAVTAAAVIFALRQAWDIVSRFSDVILVFAMAWLISFIISPIPRYLGRHPVPGILVVLLRQRGHLKWADRLDTFRLPHAVSVVTVYVCVFLTLAIISVFAIPSLVSQLVALGQSVPRLVRDFLVASLPNYLVTIEKELAAWGVDIELPNLYEPAQLVAKAELLGAEIAQTSLTLAAGLASTLVNILVILAISLYMSLDTPRLSRQLRAIIPDHYLGEVTLISQSLARTFGGFIRGQLLIALLYGLPATLLMASVGMGLAAVMGTISGLLMLVPLIGAPVAMVLPGITALLQSPHDALWLFTTMILYQQVLLHVLGPKVMAEVIGMPPLLVLLAMMLSLRIIGFWGLVFGIPLAGVMYALGTAYLEQAKIRRESLPREALEAQDGSSFRLPAMGPGCLLLPDLETPEESVRILANYLASRGITTLAIDPYRGSAQGHWQDWYASVLVGLDELWRDCNQVFVVGIGAGAALGLHAASELPVAAVAAVAVPLRQDHHYSTETEPALVASRSSQTVRPVPTSRPAQARNATARLLERVHEELPDINSPVMLLHPRQHPAITPEDARYVLERLATPHKRIEWIECPAGSTEYDWDQVAQAAFTFFRSHIS